MSSTTPIYGFPFWVLSDSPDGPSGQQALALALEAKIAAMDAILNAQIATRFKGTSRPAADDVIGTGETIMMEKVTFTAVAGRPYLVVHTDDYAIASGAPTAQTWNYRYASGATLTTAGTLLQQFVGPPPSAAHATDTRTTVFTAPSSGQFTIGCGYFTNGGATVRHYANGRHLTVVDIT
ncbi:hypothetical protein [Amycolatopsis jejuensis]|uniref:hypothetical protein n=1 Tax=Amycolatopsis jejuensis TaxID=330084 RepID=UPI0005267F7C|nr:hypothetical protein [Amycolatopsis jejuensis]